MEEGIKKILEPILRKAAVDAFNATIQYFSPDDETRERQCEVAMKNTLRDSDVEILYVTLARAFQGIDDLGQWPSTYGLADAVHEEDLATNEAKKVYNLLTKGE